MLNWAELRKFTARSFIWFICFSLFSITAFAQEQITSRTDVTALQFFALADALSLTLPTANLTGLGPGVGARVAVTEKWFALASASQLMDASAGFTATLASTFRVSAYFALGQPLVAYTTHALWNEKPVLKLKHAGDRGWAIGAGSSANFLTGNRTVLAAPGISANILYQHHVFGLAMFAELRYGLYTLNGLSANGLGASLCLPFF